MENWTAADIPDQRDCTVLITGANSGIGFHTARELAAAGATVLMGCRDPERGRTAIERIRTETPGAELELIEIDLADLASVERAAEQVSARGDHLDLLINNAGVMAIPRVETADGFEMQIGTNHLGHFALTARLLPKLLQADFPRVVTISSIAHRSGKIDLDDLNSIGSYHRWRAYSQSKLANLLFTYELDRRARSGEVELIAVAAHPGYSATNLQSVGPKMGNRFLDGIAMKIGNAVIAQSDEMGALPTLRAATDPNIESGDYVGPTGFNGMRGYPNLVDPEPKAQDKKVAARLWDLSEKLTGVSFPALN